MRRFINILPDGRIEFYNDKLNTIYIDAAEEEEPKSILNIPDTAHEITQAQYDDFFTNNGKYTFDNKGNLVEALIPDLTEAEKALVELKSSENLTVISRKLEEVIDYLANGTPLSDYPIDWAAMRKTTRQRL